MAMVITLLLVLEAVCSVSLIGLILLQKSKSEGLGVSFGGGGNDSLLGARAGNVLTKATVWIGVVFLVNIMVLGMLFSGSADKSLMKELSVPAPVAEQSAPAETSEAPAG